jgi:small subunit ribosomal protein S1
MEGDVLTGVVREVVKGGLIVNVGVKVFLPLSQLDTNIVPQTSLLEYVGKTFKFKILKINGLKKNMIISRRSLLEMERGLLREKLLHSLKVGTLCYGYIKNITSYGVFVDIKGLDGLLHFTDIS